ncbi:hypothetical protein Tco_0985896, partial [Tanacetum coccineum]
GLTVLSEVALSEADQMKLATKRSKKEFHSSHASGLGDRVDIQSKVPDEQQHTVSGTNEGAGDKLEVPDVPEYRSKNEEESWTFSQGEDEEENDEHDSANNNDKEDDDQENDSGEIESDDDRDNFVYPNLCTYKADHQEKEKEKEKANDDDEVSSDQMVSTPLDYEISYEEENQEDDDNVMGGEQEDEEDEELYGDLNLNLERRDAEMTDAQYNQEKEEVHVTFTTELPVVQQQRSSISSDLIKDAVNVAVQLKSNKLREEAQAENDEFLKQIDLNIKAIIKNQVKAQVSKIMPKVEKYITESLGAEVLARSSNQPQTSYAARKRSGKEESSKEATQKESKSISSSKGASRSQPKSSGKSAQAEGHGPRVDDLEEPLHQEFNTGNDDASPVREIIVVDE